MALGFRLPSTYKKVFKCQALGFGLPSTYKKVYKCQALGFGLPPIYQSRQFCTVLSFKLEPIIYLQRISNTLMYNNGPPLRTTAVRIPQKQNKKETQNFPIVAFFNSFPSSRCQGNVQVHVACVICYVFGVWFGWCL